VTRKADEVVQLVKSL